MAHESFHLPPENTADPHFRPKKRACGLCGEEFTTTPERRYHCSRCRSTIKQKSKGEGERVLKLPRFRHGVQE